MSRIQELAKTITEARAAYYKKQMLMSDAEYDALEDELRSLAPEHELLQVVGSDPEDELLQTSSWPIVQHERQMGSLHKTNKEDELVKWAEKYTNGVICGSEKADGFSVSLTYENGPYVQGITRGDGIKGEDITENLRLLKDTPMKIAEAANLVINPKGRWGIRGEAILLLDDYRKHFPRIEHPDGEVENSNARNCMAAVRRKSDNSACRHFSFLAFDIVDLSGNFVFTSKEEMFLTLRLLGFKTPNYWVGDIKKMLKIFEDYRDNKRVALPYEIDGLVFEADDLEFHRAQGISSQRPRAARAHKFPSQTGKSKLNTVVWQPGRTGVVTPVGKIDAVTIGGSTIESPSLMNVREICRLNLKIGSTITIERANDVIPRVIDAQGGDPIPLPWDKKGTYKLKVAFKGKDPVFKDLNEQVYCTYESISIYMSVNVTDATSIFLITDEENDEMLVKRLDNFLKTIDVKGVGGQTLQELIATKKATTIEQMLDLSQDDWAAACSGDKMAAKIRQELAVKTRNLTLPIFIKSLGLTFFGEDTTERLEEAGYDTVEKILTLTDLSVLLQIPGIKEAKAEAVVNAVTEHRDLIRRVAKFVQFKQKAAKVASGHALSGKKVCFTGVRLKGDEVAKFEATGAEEASGVSKNTDILVCKDPGAGSSKLVKAKELGITILSLEEFLRQL